MDRRKFLGATALFAAAPQVSKAASNDHFDLAEVTVAELSARMGKGAETAVSITRKYLARINELDKSTTNAVIEVNPDALRIAGDLDRERKSNGPRGPLHGIPVLIKDNIATADQMATTAGSLALVGASAPRDAFIATRLRAAGAVLLGKTNLSEWANYRSTHSVSGWSGRGGQTRNPYALDRNPCGSSSGSGAALAANLCALAVGSETDGSIVCPSSMNGVVGVKPTIGLWSRSGIIPISHSQDTAGPMARTVHDAALLLSALRGVDESDPVTQAGANHLEPDYTHFLDARGLKGARLGVARKFMGNNFKVDKLFEGLFAQLKSAGAEIIDPADLPSSDHDVGEAESAVLSYEFKADLNAYLSGLGPNAPVKSLADVIVFNQQHRDTEMPWFGQELFEKSEARGPLTDQTYIDALAKSKRLTREEGIDAVMQKNNLDALIAPTAGPSWLIDWVNGDSDTGGCSTPAAVAGYPHVTVPAGFVEGLPIGMSFFGAAWSEGKLLKLAYAFEQMTKARREPQFLKTLSLTESLPPSHK
jgi:amidase